KFPPGSRYFLLDLADPESVEQISRRRIEPVDYLFWVSGKLSRVPLDQMVSDEVDEMIGINLSGPVRAIQLIHFDQHYLVKKPYHLVTIASTSSWRMRNNETLYCALKAAKAAFTRNFARELVRDLPGSKATLVNPGGIKTGLFQDVDQDTTNFMDPDEVARIIWNEVERQKEQFKEVQVMRTEDGRPDVSYGPRLPELPFDEIVIPIELKNKGILNAEQLEVAREALGFKS
ncbi:MAG: SDR family oxidoreductase, partial [Candidatus Colwellbacteria bacterium]|nr:SDR family oxidoreductase [Candidatus Colwellbacteria bacterium]